MSNTITLEQAIEQRDAYLAASLAVTRNQSYTVNNRHMTRVDARYIASQITFWNHQIKTLTALAAGAKSPGNMIGVFSGSAR